jgi:hypothetical protein
MHVEFIFRRRVFMLQRFQALPVDHDAAVGLRAAGSIGKVCVLPFNEPPVRCDQLSACSVSVGRMRVLLLDECRPDFVPCRILLHFPVYARKQVRCALQLECIFCLRVESAYHALPGCVVAVCAAEYDEPPFLPWIRAEV